MLLSPELLRDPGDTPAELSEVSVRLSENLFGLSDSPATLLLTYSDSELKKLISVTKKIEVKFKTSRIINHRRWCRF